MTSQQNLGLVLFLATALSAGQVESDAPTAHVPRGQPRSLDVLASEGRASAKAPTPAGGAVLVTYREGHLSISAERVSLARVLQEVAHRTEIEVRGAEVLREHISVHFSNIRLAEALRRLLTHRADYVLVEKKSAQRGIPSIQVLVHRGATSRPSVTIPATEPVEDVEQLEVQGDQQTLPRLLKALNDPDSRVRVTTAEALGHLKSSLATEALIDATRDPAPRVRIAALRSLAYYVRDASAKAALEQNLIDEDERIQAVAAELMKTFVEEQLTKKEVMRDM